MPQQVASQAIEFGSKDVDAQRGGQRCVDPDDGDIGPMLPDHQEIAAHGVGPAMDP